MNQPDPALWLICAHCGTITSRKVSEGQCSQCGWAIPGDPRPSDDKPMAE